MKAIETIYKGYRFRSRLEARWAVFFDALNWRYEYELEGFDLGSVWYLPDFYLSDYDLWVEIKPVPEMSLSEMEKISLFAKQVDHTAVLIGTPGGDSSALRWIEGKQHRAILALAPGTTTPCFILDPSDTTKRLLDTGRGSSVCAWRRAVRAARQARFEFGEKGN
jgi:hypothetical protein